MAESVTEVLARHEVVNLEHAAPLQVVVVIVTHGKIFGFNWNHKSY